MATITCGGCGKQIEYPDMRPCDVNGRPRYFYQCIYCGYNNSEGLSLLRTRSSSRRVESTKGASAGCWMLAVIAYLALTALFVKLALDGGTFDWIVAALMGFGAIYSFLILIGVVPGRKD